MRYHSFAGISPVRPSARTLVLQPFCNPNARVWMAREGSSCVPSWHPPCPPRLRVFMRMAILPIGPAACNRGDRTDGTDGSTTSHEETLAYYFEVWHLAAVPGLRIRVSTRPREPGYRVEDAPGSTRRTGQAGAGVARPLQPGDHAAALRALDHGSKGEGRRGTRRGDENGDRGGAEGACGAGAAVRQVATGERLTDGPGGRAGEGRTHPRARPPRGSGAGWPVRPSRLLWARSLARQQGETDAYQLRSAR